jgi:hypothetical protein
MTLKSPRFLLDRKHMPSALPVCYLAVALVPQARLPAVLVHELQTECSARHVETGAQATHKGAERRGQTEP